MSDSNTRAQRGFELLGKLVLWRTDGGKAPPTAHPRRVGVLESNGAVRLLCPDCGNYTGTANPLELDEVPEGDLEELRLIVRRCLTGAQRVLAHGGSAEEQRAALECIIELCQGQGAQR